MSEESKTDSAESIARCFHETYEALAPSFGYETREASAKPWADVPAQNKGLLKSVVQTLIMNGVISPGGSHPEVQLAACPADGHDGEHFQVRTHEHWLCGHLLAGVLANAGIPSPLAAARDEYRDNAILHIRERDQAREQLAAVTAERDAALKTVDDLQGELADARAELDAADRAGPEGS